LVQNVKKVMASNIWHCFCTYRAKQHRCLLYISALSCHTASCRHIQCWKQDQKYKTKTKTKTEAGLRPVLSYDRGLRPQDWLYSP